MFWTAGWSASPTSRRSIAMIPMIVLRCGYGLRSLPRAACAEWNWRRHLAGTARRFTTQSTDFDRGGGGVSHAPRRGRGLSALVAATVREADPLPAPGLGGGAAAGRWLGAAVSTFSHNRRAESLAAKQRQVARTRRWRWTHSMRSPGKPESAGRRSDRAIHSRCKWTEKDKGLRSRPETWHPVVWIHPGSRGVGLHA